MNLEEYKKIKDYNYDDYCKYLQEKYGIPKKPYFCNKKFKNQNKIQRSSEGLFIHHIREDKGVMLSNPKYAMLQPFEYQMPENLVYCDYLEHLLLHILICEKEPFGFYNEKNKIYIDVENSEIKKYIIPELNDFYSGYISSKEYENKSFEVIKNDKNIFLELISRYFFHYWCKATVQKHELKRDFITFIGLMVSPFSIHKIAGWNEENNSNLYDEITSMIINCNKNFTTYLGFKPKPIRKYYEKELALMTSRLNNVTN
jgi:hypothetical protein